MFNLWILCVKSEKCKCVKTVSVDSKALCLKTVQSMDFRVLSVRDIYCFNISLRWLLKTLEEIHVISIVKTAQKTIIGQHRSNTQLRWKWKQIVFWRPYIQYVTKKWQCCPMKSSFYEKKTWSIDTLIWYKVSRTTVYIYCPSKQLHSH